MTREALTERRGRKPRYRFHVAAVGESFDVPRSDAESAHRVSSLAYDWGKRLGRRFQIKTRTTVVRVTRVA